MQLQQRSIHRRTYRGIPSKDLSRKVVFSERVLTIRTRISHYSALSRGISQFWISSCHTGLHIEMTCDCSPRLSQLQQSWCDIQAVKGYKVTLNTFDVHLLPPGPYTDKKKKLQVKNEPAALEGRKSKTEYQVLKGKKEQINYSIYYQHLRNKKLRKPQPTRSRWMLQGKRNYC